MRKKILITAIGVATLFASCTQNPNNTKETTSKTSEKVEIKDFGPEPFVFNIEEYTLQNETFRTSLWTGTSMQMTLMNILPGEDIGLELHTTIDQFLRVESGSGIVKMGDSGDNLSFEKRIEDDFAIFIPAGKWHNIINDSDEPLKLYSIYAPVEHPHSTVHQTKADGGEPHSH